MDKITREMRLMQWTSIIRECRNSGMPVRTWCLENNVNLRQFYYWHRSVSGEGIDTLKKTEPKNKSKFVELQAPADSSINKASFSTDMVIHIGNNTLEVSNTVSEELLSKVLKVMSVVK